MLDHPNIKVPLALSHDQRSAVPDLSSLNIKDQRKANCYYDLYTNAVTGNKTAFLAKRLGINYASTVGASTQTSYVIGTHPNFIYLLGIKDASNNIKVGTTSGLSSTILTHASKIPSYLTTGSFSGNSYAILQIGDGTGWCLATDIYTSSDGSTWTNITDTDFTGASRIHGQMAIMNGYAFALDNNNNIIHSDLNDPTTWSALSTIKRQLFNDTPMGLSRLRNLILAFGTKGVEVFYNAGNRTGSTLGTLPHLATEIGLRYPTVTNYACTIVDKLYFIGSEGSPQAASRASALYVFDGTKFEKINQPTMNRIITEVGIQGVFSVPYNGKHAVAMQLSNVASTSGATWLMYFPDVDEWFEWTSEVWQPHNNGRFFIGQARSGNSTSHKVFEFAPSGQTYYADEHTDGGSTTNFPWILQLKIPQQDGLPFRIPYCGLIGDTNTSATSLTLSKSIDDGQNWTNVGTIDMTRARKAKYGLGMYQSEMQLRFEYTGTEPLRLREFYASVK